MPRGGRRPGAGRPLGSREPKTLDKEAAREVVRRRVTEALLPLVDAQIAAATGLKYLVTRSKTGGKFTVVTEAMARARKGNPGEIIEVWEKFPSTHAFQELLNRALDRPKEQSVDMNVCANEDLLKRLDEGRARVAAARARQKS